jgi:hypothetical protein
MTGDNTMTEPNGEPEPRSEAWAATAADEDEVFDAKTVRKLRNECARLRVKLKEAEASMGSERESNLARLAAYERDAVERAAATTLIDGEDIWRYTDEATQAEFNDEFGAIVSDNVVEAAKRVIAQRPHLARPQNTPPPTARPLEGLRPGASPPEQKKPAPSWHTALRGG